MEQPHVPPRRALPVNYPADLGHRPAAFALRQIALDHAEAAGRKATSLLRADAAKSKKRSQKKQQESQDQRLHDFRVNVRRLRTLLAHYEGLALLPAGLTKRLKAIFRATSSDRDLSVQLRWLDELSADGAIEARASREVLLARRKRKQAGLEAKVHKALTRYVHKWLPAARSRLEVHAVTPVADVPLLYEVVAGERVTRTAAELRLRLATFATTLDDEALHEARLAVKRTRYLIEPLRNGAYELAPLIDDCRYLQQWLGDARDLRLLGRTLMLTKAKGEARLELDTYSRAAAEMASELVDKALAHGLRHRVRSEGGPFDGWVDALERAGSRLCNSGGQHKEIERKYLLSALPEEVASHACLTMAQGYLPGKEIRERLRRIEGPKGVSYRRTIKAGRGVERIEFEEPIEAAFFESLWPLTEGARVHKRRYIVPAGEVTWEIDEFVDRELFLAEVELSSKDQEVVLPDWLAPYVVRDVTDESGFVNQKLAR